MSLRVDNNEGGGVCVALSEEVRADVKCTCLHISVFTAVSLRKCLCEECVCVCVCVCVWVSVYS